MLRARAISVEEEQALIGYYKGGSSHLVRQRAQGILLSSKGMKASTVAEYVFCEIKAVRRWIKDFNERGLSSLFPSYGGNQNASKLTKKQKEEVKTVLAAPPSDYGLPYEFWSVPQLKQYVQSRFGVVYESPRSYHYLLEHSGFSWKLPSPFDIRRDDEFIEQRMREIEEEIAPLLESKNWEVFAADESKVTWETEIRRAWLRKGKKTVMKVDRTKKHQNYFGALNLETGKEILVPLTWQNQETMIFALEKLTEHYPHKRICVIWDNARWHKGKDLRAKLRKGQSLEHVHLINFPPYAPDKNPQEKVWKEGKDAIANKRYDSFEQLTRLFQKTLHLKTFNYRN